MRIAIADISDRLLGGVEAYVDLLIPELVCRGHEVLFVHEHAGASGPPRIPALSAIECVSCGSDGGDRAAMGRVAEWRPDVVFGQAFADPMREAELFQAAPSVFFAHDYHGTCISGNKTHQRSVPRQCERTLGPACLLLYMPCRCGGRDPRTMLREYRRQRQRLAALAHADTIVTFSEHMRREYMRHGFQPDRVVRLPPVYPGLTNSVTTTPRSYAANELRLCFVGRVERLKGVHVLIEALRELSSRVEGRVLLTVAGQGTDLDLCRSLAADVMAARPTVRVEFTGWLPKESCSALVDQSDVLVMPSLWPEPFGLSGAEAVQRGVPVAAFRTGAVPEWLFDNQNGALAPGNPPTSTGLVDAIIRARSIAQRRSAYDTPAATMDSNIRVHVESLLPVLSRAADASSHQVV